MLFYKHVIAGVLLAGLMACGFTPVHGPDSKVTGFRNQVTVAEPSTREGFFLTRALENRLGRVENGQYKLNYLVTTGRTGTGITAADSTTRFNIIGTATFTLLEANSGKILFTGRETNFTSYITSVSTVATQASEEDAELRLMEILADQIRDRLIAFQSEQQG